MGRFTGTMLEKMAVAAALVVLVLAPAAYGEPRRGDAVDGGGDAAAAAPRAFEAQGGPGAGDAAADAEKMSDTEEFLRFQVSGGIGTALFVGMYRVMLPVADAVGAFGGYANTAAYFVSYVVSIVWQTALHRALVFGAEGSSFLEALLAAYVTYSLSIGLSTLLNAGMTKLGFKEQVAYWISLLATGFLNYFTLNAVMGSD